MHLNKTACEIWSGFDKVHFCAKNLTPFFHRTLQLSLRKYNLIFTHTSFDIIVYPMTTRDRAKVTASKTRNNKFILDALNGLIDGRQFITTLVYSEEKKTHSHTSCKLMVFTTQDKINISVHSMAEWFRMLDLKSGGPWFESGLHPTTIWICS